jgi:hypothetical protein
VNGAGRREMWGSYRLWSLLDVLKISAAAYMGLGSQLERAVAVFEDVEDIIKRPFGRLMEEQETNDLREALKEALAECKMQKATVAGFVRATPLAH